MTARPYIAPKNIGESLCDARAYRAMPQAARAATPTGLSRFASSCKHRIAIALSGAATPAPITPSTGVGGTARLSVGGRSGRASGGNAVARGFDSSPAATLFDTLCIAVPTFAASWFAAALLSGWAA
jgi:hypothetical protein